MKINRRSRIVLILTTLAATVLLTSTARAQNKSYWVLYDFQGGSDGFNPSGPPAVAKNGDLYGGTFDGGTYAKGMAYKLTAPKTRGGVWKKSAVYEFPGGNGGAGPVSLLFGADGNLYGADSGLFELSAPKSRSGSWKYHRLYTLNGTTDGQAIQGIALDAEGNIYRRNRGGRRHELC